jgi:hypothetical protein
VNCGGELASMPPRSHGTLQVSWESCRVDEGKQRRLASDVAQVGGENGVCMSAAVTVMRGPVKQELEAARRKSSAAGRWRSKRLRVLTSMALHHGSLSAAHKMAAYDQVCIQICPVPLQSLGKGFLSAHDPSKKTPIVCTRAPGTDKQCSRERTAIPACHIAPLRLTAISFVTCGMPRGMQSATSVCLATHLGQPRPANPSRRTFAPRTECSHQMVPRRALRL